MGKLERMMDAYFDPPEYEEDEAYEELEDKIRELEDKIEDLEIELEHEQERNEPIPVSFLMSNTKIINYLCPSCESTFIRGMHDGFEVRYKYCPNCGQRLEWGEEK